MKQNKDFFVSVIATVSNDADILQSFLREVTDVLKNNYENYEFVLIDDCSTDRSQEIIEKFLKIQKHVRCLRLSKKVGNEIAISAGLDTVIGDVIVILDLEKDPPKFIPKMVEMVRKTNSIVFGINQDINSTLSIQYRMAKWVYHRFVRLLFNFYPPENVSYFIGLSRQHLNAIIQIKDRSKFLRIFSAQIGFQKIEMPYHMQLRRKKPLPKPFLERIHYAIDGITTNSLTPLQLISALCFLASMVNLGYMFFVFLVKVTGSNIASGWTTLSMQISLEFFIMFLAFAVIAQYIIRLIDDSKDRPLYYVADEKNSSVMISQRKKGM